MITLKRVTTSDELLGILALQKRNLKESLNEDDINREGFVTIEHDLDTLTLMNTLEPHIIAVDNGIIVGYALVMVRQLKDKIPVLKPMFNKLDEISYKSIKISDSQFYVMGQICIDINYRSQGIFAGLYEKHKTELRSKFDYCITEVSIRNTRSVKAHEKVGFENIHSFSDETDDWNIILLDLKKTSD